MADIARITRRTFLAAAGATAAGLAVGSYLYKHDPANPLLQDRGEGDAVLNFYVRVNADGITLITPRADLGQGAYSVQAALLAEELDLAWGEFQFEPGPPRGLLQRRLAGRGLSHRRHQRRRRNKRACRWRN